MSDSSYASCSQGTRAPVPCFCFAKSCFCFAEVMCYAHRTLHFVQGHVLCFAKHMTCYTTFSIKRSCRESNPDLQRDNLMR